LQVACQDNEEDEDEQQAEYDGMLIESAGDVLPVMARLLGGPTFAPFFASFITDLLKRLVCTGTSVLTVTCLYRSSILYSQTVSGPLEHIPY
jgi:hypothetical protein